MIQRASSELIDLVTSAARDAMGEAMDAAVRADGHAAPMSPERVMVKRHLLARADALGLDVESPRGQRWLRECARFILRPSDTRADAAYYDGTLRAQYSGSILMTPTQDRADIMSGIPVRQVAAGAKTYMLRGASVSGQAQPYSESRTSYPRPSYDLTESEAPLGFWCFEIPDSWLTSMYDSFAGLDKAAMNMQALRTAFVEAEYSTRINGYGPLGGLFGIGIPELTSAQTYTGATAIEDLYSDFLSLVDEGRLSNPTGGVYDTLIVSDRPWYRMSHSSNLGSGGSTDAQTQIVAALQARGISRIIVGRSLRDVDGGTDVDGALLFQSSDEFGIKQVRQMGATPVHTYQSANGSNTVYAASWGGIECPKPETALILKLPTS
jgi:hypothetical protein